MVGSSSSKRFVSTEDSESDASSGSIVGTVVVRFMVAGGSEGRVDVSCDVWFCVCDVGCVSGASSCVTVDSRW